MQVFLVNDNIKPAGLHFLCVQPFIQAEVAEIENFMNFTDLFSPGNGYKSCHQN
jgi:hypothetical protein